MPSFAPGVNGKLVITTANTTQSVTLPKLILAAVQSHARWFNHHPQFAEKSFEMVTDLHGYYAPTGEVATFINFQGLFELDMKQSKPVGTFLTRVCNAELEFYKGGLDLEPVLVNFFIINSLSDKFHQIC